MLSRDADANLETAHAPQVQYGRTKLDRLGARSEDEENARHSKALICGDR